METDKEPTENVEVAPPAVEVEPDKEPIAGSSKTEEEANPDPEKEPEKPSEVAEKQMEVPEVEETDTPPVDSNEPKEPEAVAENVPVDPTTSTPATDEMEVDSSKCSTEIDVEECKSDSLKEEETKPDSLAKDDDLQEGCSQITLTSESSSKEIDVCEDQRTEVDSEQLSQTTPESSQGNYSEYAPSTTEETSEITSSQASISEITSMSEILSTQGSANDGESEKTVDVDMNETVETIDSSQTSDTVDKNTEDLDEGSDKAAEDKPNEEQNPLEKTLSFGEGEEDESQKEDTQFVGVSMDKEEQEKEINHKEGVEEDPIGAETLIPESQEGADEELCIIPDTERVISQEEKDAAISMQPLKELSEVSVAAKKTTPEETADSSDKYVITKCNSEQLQTCMQCVLKRKVKYTVTKGDKVQYICHDACLDNFKSANIDGYTINFEGEIRVKDDLVGERFTPKLSFERKCVVCKKVTDDEENNLTWEIMDFCNEFCLSKYQKEIGSVCASCTQDVQPNSLGKYCVRFGNDIRQFCSSHCLEEYKKGLKVCSYCQQDMSSETSEGFLAPVGDKGQFKDFCSQKCMENYDIMTNNKPPKVKEGTTCSVCKSDNPITIQYDSDGVSHYFCSDRCLVAFSFVNNISPSKCSMCKRYFPNEVLEKNTMFYDNVQYSFCSNSCQNIYIIAHRKIVPCVWCKVKKYNFDMIRRYFKNGPVLNMCSIHCLSLFRVSVNAVHSKKTICNFCNKKNQPMYHLTMSDATIRNFCSYSCVMSFQNKFKKPVTLANSKDPVPAGEPKKNKKFATDSTTATKSTSPPLPVISSVTSLASKNGTAQQNATTRVTRTTKVVQNQNAQNATSPDPQIQIRHHVIVKPTPAVKQRNVSTMCRIKFHHKGTTMRPVMYDKGIQTEKENAKHLIPVPVPIFIPSPLPMYSAPSPYPVPFPLPIPIPIFIPTTRNSAKGIMKEIKKIQVKIPTDPYEAELLMMAEMVAGDKKEEHTDSESEVDEGPQADDSSFSPEPVDASNTFGDDMLQMALKMASELEEPAVDLEGALTANTITASQNSEAQTEETVEDPQPMLQLAAERQQSFRGKKRASRGSKSGGGSKKRRMSQQSDMSIATQTVSTPEPSEKPDAHLCLKYTFGVNAWKQWVTTKNVELEKQSKYAKPFKTEILQLTADELNYSLCLFVKEVRKPNGAEYAPDTIYYLCLGIQQYLFENNRIDNIFCDPYYEQFTDSLDEIARKFSVLYNDSHYIVTRVEEEHLWESKQLGAHSPHVLLSTLMFFNTKHFNLTTVDEHMQLSFSHIMKHWKRNPNQAGVARVPGSRNVLLRFYPPQSSIQSNSRKKKVYEQQENDENPLRCPVKLYEFYLSKCPESVKTRNDVFYLQPERSCVPDSPVWYSTTALPKEALEKMLHRVKMVKEINVALLTC